MIECAFCRKSVSIDMKYCPHCGAYLQNKMVNQLISVFGEKEYRRKENFVSKGHTVPLQDSILVGKFWEVFVIPLLLKQRELIQSYYEETMGVTFEDAPFDFVEDCDILKQ